MSFHISASIIRTYIQGQNIIYTVDFGIEIFRKGEKENEKMTEKKP